jgi:DNA-binding transcriptional ArsR family regulator
MVMMVGSVLSALADPTRRSVFEGLRGGPVAVGELAAGLPVSRPAVSQHLRVLADAGLVRGTGRGRTHVWEIEPARLADARQWLDRISDQWDEALARLKSSLEE